MDWESWRGVLGRPRGRLGIRLGDVGMTAVVLVAVELSVAAGNGPDAAPLNARAYFFGAVLVLPVLLRNRHPRFELLACSVLLLLYYTFDRRDISPAPLLSVPLYDAALAGFLLAAIVIPSVYMAIGLVVVEISNHWGLVTLINNFLPSMVVLALAIMLGDAVRSRRALAAETAERLRVAHEEREAEAARRVAEERLRIARDLHDTVAHSMATITVQAGSAVRVVARGDALLAPSVTRSLIAAFTAKSPGPAPRTGPGPALPGGIPGGAPGARPHPEPAAPPGLATLTDREREVVALVAAGLSNDEIAARLVVSPLTAKTHVSRAMTKLAARDRAQLVVLAYAHGLASPSA